MTGRVYLVGAGPGACDLLTLRAARILAQADIVLHDALVSRDVLALAANARLINVGKRAGRASTDQAFISRLLVRSAKRYAVVVRLKGGDPMLFGRAQEEIDACRAAGVPVEVTPGITAAFAAAADIQTSLTQRLRARSVTFVTPATARGANANDDWADAAAAAEVAVIYMGKSEAGRIRDALHARGVRLETPALLIVNASLPDRRVVSGTLKTLAERAERTGDDPAIILVGDVFAATSVDKSVDNFSVLGNFELELLQSHAR